MRLWTGLISGGVSSSGGIMRRVVVGKVFLVSWIGSRSLMSLLDSAC